MIHVPIRAGASAFALFVGLVVSACRPTAFSCVDDSQCRIGGVWGRCVAPGYCGFPSEDCASGLAFGAHADAGLGGECVPRDVPTDGSTSDEFEPTDTAASDGAFESTGPRDGTTGTSSTGPTDGTGTGSSSTSPNGVRPGDLGDGLSLWLAMEEDPQGDNGPLDQGPHALGVTCLPGGCPELVAGAVGNAAAFDGFLDALILADDPALRPADAFTIAFWGRIDDEPSPTMCIVCKPVGQGNQNSYQVAVTLHELVFAVRDDGSKGIRVPSPFGAGAWVHIAAVWDGTQAHLWVGGELAGSQTANSPIYDDMPFLVGADINTSELEHFWEGELDEVRLYHRALQDEEILALAEE